MRRPRIEFKIVRSVLGVVAVLASSTAALVAMSAVALKPGAAATFALSPAGGRLIPEKIRRSMIGPADPAAGEITVGLAPPGGAVGAARLHVYERRSKIVTFKATAFAGMRMLAAETVCGHLDMDAWITLPAKTSEVVLSDFAETDKPCD